ncbi:hypothetical protein CPB83DRAFT_911627 [Crepidotus variabilis]|uniref:Uncharacterized protein n=1 Tax=Crepidotus variabilis TaxID=179855 RepID=A0A9P6JIA3_9AGAR|nr:hypothetical protein CPB83DRAFT_911627 [Crepidotus variabilis]
MAPSTPPTGRYMIRSVMTRNYIGRSQREDRSLLPKRIVLLSDGVRPTEFVFNTSGREAKITAGGSPTAAIDNKLYSVLLDTPPAQQWVVQRVSESGPAQYIITTQDGSAAWVVSGQDPESQVSVLQSVRFDPSTAAPYPPRALWDIVPLDY